MIQSRRDFLKNAGKIAVAASMASVLPVGALAEKAEHPFTYTRLDPEATADRAYASFSALGGCCIGVADAIIGQLADTVGAPFDGIPVMMFQNGAAGYGVNSLCGCLGGAAACIGLVCESADSKAILAELMKWYRESELPAYDRGEPALAAVVPSSNNCIDSLAKFFEATGITSMSDPGRINRCACLAADTARKT
ncbi:MAG: C-GCAxxG-C-C family (seleno)protein, partial [Clostridia bacterium]|nr:C-GCAxxG-C-C family (seleno)protein [Clostridia bacterium]